MDLSKFLFAAALDEPSGQTKGDAYDEDLVDDLVQGGTVAGWKVHSEHTTIQKKYCKKIAPISRAAASEARTAAATADDNGVGHCLALLLRRPLPFAVALFRHFS